MPNNTPWTSNKIWAAAAAATVPLVVSLLLGMMFRPGEWFCCLIRPCWMPPGLVFALVWSALYILLGIGMVAACYHTDEGWTWALPIVNIAVTLLFAPLFFGMHSIVSGAMITFFSLLLGILLIIQYSLVNDSSLAVWLTVPYIVWLVLANAMMWSVYCSNVPHRLAECNKKFPKKCMPC